MSTRSPSRIASTAWMSVPSSILPPLGSSETETWIGTLRPTLANASRAPATAARTSRMSWAVSTISRSTPPSISAPACSSKTSARRLKVMSPSVGSSLAGRKPVGPIEPATKRSGPGRSAGDLGGAAVDLDRVLAQAPLLELDP